MSVLSLAASQTTLPWWGSAVDCDGGETVDASWFPCLGLVELPGYVSCCFRQICNICVLYFFKHIFYSVLSVFSAGGLQEQA